MSYNIMCSGYSSLWRSWNDSIIFSTLADFFFPEIFLGSFYGTGDHMYTWYILVYTVLAIMLELCNKHSNKNINM